MHKDHNGCAYSEFFKSGFVRQRSGGKSTAENGTFEFLGKHEDM